MFSHFYKRLCACVYLCLYVGCQCTVTHTLSRTVRLSPNGTAGTRYISILKGDISESEPCGRVQHNHSDSLTATQEGCRTDTSDCGSAGYGIVIEYGNVVGFEFKNTCPIKAVWYFNCWCHNLLKF